MKALNLLVITILLLPSMNCYTQTTEDLQKKYAVFNRTISPGIEPGSVHMNDAEGEGHAWLNHARFTNGIIEVDIKGKDKLQSSFVGIAFHGVNDSSFEAVYFRPFNFRSTDPIRKLHAVQYIASPKFGWEKLRNEFPGKYEQPISPAPDPNEWVHTRIVVNIKTIRVYVNGNATPSLIVQPLVHTKGTLIGLWTDSDGDWKNLKIVNESK